MASAALRRRVRALQEQAARRRVPTDDEYQAARQRQGLRVLELVCDLAGVHTGPGEVDHSDRAIAADADVVARHQKAFPWKRGATPRWINGVRIVRPATPAELATMLESYIDRQLRPPAPEVRPSAPAVSGDVYVGPRTPPASTQTVEYERIAPSSPAAREMARTAQRKPRVHPEDERAGPQRFRLFHETARSTEG